MGADYIGYILLGPVAVNLPDFNTIIPMVEERLEVCRKWVESEGDEPIPKCIMEADIDPDEILYLSEQSAKALVQNFYDVWRGVVSDIMLRIDPEDENRQVVAVGEVTHGDLPGGSYRVVRHAIFLGMLEPLGIH